MVQQKRKRAGGKNKHTNDISNTDKKELVEFNFEGDDLVSDNEKSQGEEDVPKLTPEEEQGTLGLIDGDQGSDDSDSDDDAESETESKDVAAASKVEKSKEGKEEAKEVKVKDDDEEEDKTVNPAISDAMKSRELDDDYDSTDNEEPDTIGNIPHEWYDEYDHIGYDFDGKKIPKAKIENAKIKDFLARKDDPNYWRTVYDAVRERKVVLSDEDLRLINSFMSNKLPGTNNEEMPVEKPLPDNYDVTPWNNSIPRKRSFIPSKTEIQQAGKLAHAIRMGWIKLDKPTKEPKFYDIWAQEGPTTTRYRPAPKASLPTHAESYNPPEEYLMTDAEKKKWNEDPESRKLNFVPEKFGSLREVPLYKKLLNDHFDRCVELFMMPRQTIRRPDIDPESLLPTLPPPSELRPFPSHVANVYPGHTGKVESIDVSPDGMLLASGSDDCTVRVFDVLSGRCLKVFKFAAAVSCVKWNPNLQRLLLAMAVEENVFFADMASEFAQPYPAPKAEKPTKKDGAEGEESDNDETDADEEEAKKQAERYKNFVPTKKLLASAAEGLSVASSTVEWCKPEDALVAQGIALCIKRVDKQPVERMNWHAKGEYLATIAPNALRTTSVIVHHLAKRASLNPFKLRSGGTGGKVVDVAFHTTKPILYIATQKAIRAYDLALHKLHCKLKTNSHKVVTSIAVHPSGDNLIAGLRNGKVLWFDIEFSLKPIRTLPYHKDEVTGVAMHQIYPLFASCSDDATTHVFHGKVFDDWTQEAFIVPLRILKGHGQRFACGVSAVVFHPREPWLFTAGIDGNTVLYTDVL